MTPLTWRRDASTASDLRGLLEKCDASFTPPLSSRVDIAAYADKIARLAQRSEAWADDALIGVVALYRADAPAGRGFISNVSVAPAHRGQGVARRLLQDSLARADADGAGYVDLEVDSGAVAALRLYADAGFKTLGERNGVRTLRYAPKGMGPIAPRAGEPLTQKEPTP